MSGGGGFTEDDDILLYGNSFQRAGVRLDPARVGIVSGPDGEVQFFTYKQSDGTIINMPAREVTHHRRIRYQDVCGVLQTETSVVGLTDAERDILNKTADIWNQFTKLPVQHPSDVPELQLYIHQIQQLIATRVARRVNPEVWR